MIGLKNFLSNIEGLFVDYRQSNKTDEEIVTRIKELYQEYFPEETYPDTDRVITPGITYRCWKGGLYYVDSIGYNTETGEKLVCYHSLYLDFKHYVRPYNMFASKVPEGREEDNITNQEYRFEVYTILPGQVDQPRIIKG